SYQEKHMDIKTIGVVGAGAMGGGIAHQAAKCGLNVILCDVKQEFVDGAVDRASKLMDRQITRGKITEDEKTAILSRMKTTTDMKDMAAADFVVEAIIEDLKIKQDVFKALDEICRQEVILATNTSSMSVTSIASATGRADRVVGMHFFNPVQVMKLVEIIKGYGSSEETLETVKQVSEALGKTCIVAEKDTPGFVVNRLLFALFSESMKMVEEGIATPEDIDTGIKLGLGHPMGPFQLMDEIGGLDLASSVLNYFYKETGDAKWAVPHNMKSLIRAGRVGKKAGAGWYEYS
ncbi:MAG: 3-hydroxyacyl-CoA dehydrogenase family protein, partial [Spirochaetales bacterium]|nr:3-hydroxyacyl-CoA dehydrogenase family protein [Spirochaetales bacterium]